jgi:hypothetical protein
MKFLIILIALTTLVGCSVLGTKPDPGVKLTWKKVSTPVPGVPGLSIDIWENQPGAKAELTVWYFWGLFENKTTDQAELESRFADYPPMKMVMPAFKDNVWLFTRYPNRAASEEPQAATLENFDRMFKYITDTYALPGKPIVMGHSMGGVNTATLCSTRHWLWKACVMTYPALVNTDPWQAFPWRPARFIVQSQLPGKPNLQLAKAIWKRDNPYAMLKEASAALPPIFIAGCSTDMFQLFEATAAYAKQAQAQDNQVTWLPLYKNCDHLNPPAEPVRQFVLKVSAL